MVKLLEFEEEPPRRADATYSVLEYHGVLVPSLLRDTPCNSVVILLKTRWFFKD
jgi:hypothetical protein